MDAWDRFLQSCVEDSKEAKKRSREFEIWILDHADEIGGEVAQEMIQSEMEYRKYLDSEIEEYQERLVERKEGKNEVDIKD